MARATASSAVTWTLCSSTPSTARAVRYRSIAEYAAGTRCSRAVGSGEMTVSTCLPNHDAASLGKSYCTAQTGQAKSRTLTADCHDYPDLSAGVRVIEGPCRSSDLEMCVQTVESCSRRAPALVSPIWYVSVHMSTL